MQGNPVKGAAYLLRGFRLITQPSLRRFVAVPLLINILVFTAGIWLAIEQFGDWLDRFTSRLPDWLQWLEWLIWPLFAIALLLIVFYTFTVVANLIAAPFNSLLAEKVEKHLTGRTLGVESGERGILGEILSGIVDELRKLLYFVLRAIPLLFLFVIPVINIVAPLLWLLFSAWCLALDYADYPMGNHELKFSAQRQRLRQKFLLALGFGGSTLGATLIPILNFFTIPAAVAGATAMWVEEYASIDTADSEIHDDS